MKKITVLLLLLFFALTHADNNWVKSYYFSVGFGGAFTQGDLDGNKRISTTENGTTEVDIFPNTGFYIIPELETGANLNQHTVFVDLSYSYPKTSYGLDTEEADETNTNIFRLGFGYRYNFFWPNLFQPFVGLNYSYMYLNTRNNVYIYTLEDVSRTNGAVMGNGVALHGGVLYYVEKHITMQLHARVRAMFFSKFGNDVNGNRDLDSSLKHFSEELIFKIACHF